MCLFINALKLVLTRIDPGVSMSMSSALVHFKCPDKQARAYLLGRTCMHTHAHMYVLNMCMYTYSVMCLILFLLKIIFHKEISKTSFCLLP